MRKEMLEVLRAFVDRGRGIHRYPNHTDIPPETARCGVSVMRRRDCTLVTVRERPDNPGQGIGGFAGHLATRVCQRYDLDPMTLVWVEERLPRRLALRSGSHQMRVLRQFAFDLDTGHFAGTVGLVPLDEREYRALKRAERDGPVGVSLRAVQVVTGTPMDWTDVADRPECRACGAMGVVVPAFEVPDHRPLEGVPGEVFMSQPVHVREGPARLDALMDPPAEAGVGW